MEALFIVKLKRKRLLLQSHDDLLPPAGGTSSSSAAAATAVRGATVATAETAVPQRYIIV